MTTMMHYDGDDMTQRDAKQCDEDEDNTTT